MRDQVSAPYKSTDSTVEVKIFSLHCRLKFDFQILTIRIAAFQAVAFLTSKSFEEDINQEPKYLKSSTCLIGPSHTKVS